MSGGKGGSTTQTNQVPDWVNQASQDNVALADEIAQLGPIRNYGPTVAAFNPTQQAGFQNNADMASAFGMNAPSNPMNGMPAAQDFGGGIMAHSASPVVDQSLANLQMNDPDQYAAMTGLYMDPGAPASGVLPALAQMQKRIG